MSKAPLATQNERATLSSITYKGKPDIEIGMNIDGTQRPNTPMSAKAAQTSQYDEYDRGMPKEVTKLDFISPANAVKDLFSMPYNNDAGVAVAVHNIGGGTLLLDGVVLNNYGNNANINSEQSNTDSSCDRNYAMDSGNQNSQAEQTDATKTVPIAMNANHKDESSCKRNLSVQTSRINHNECQITPSSESVTSVPTKPDVDNIERTTTDLQLIGDEGQINLLSALISHKKNITSESDVQMKPTSKSDIHLSTIETGGKVHTIDSGNHPQSISLIQQQILKAASTSTGDWKHLQNCLLSLNETKIDANQISPFLESIDEKLKRKPQQQPNQHTQNEMMNILPKPDHYTRDIVTSPKAPREFLKWRFRDFNLLVGSDALILRTGDGNDANEDNVNKNNHPKPSVGSESSKSTIHFGVDVNIDTKAQEGRLQQIKADVEGSGISQISNSSESRQKSCFQQKKQQKHEPENQQQHLHRQHHQQHYNEHNHNQGQQPKQEKQSNLSQLAIRLADSDLSTKLRRHEEMVKSTNNFVSNPHSNRQNVSYADVVSKNSRGQTLEPGNHDQITMVEDSGSNHRGGHIGLDNVSLRTCVIPSTELQSHLRQYGFSATPYCKKVSGHNQSIGTTISSSPVYTALDAYLDNIMANVPQLALCLQEKGFVQSIRLLRTEDIPSLSSSDLEGAKSSSTPGTLRGNASSRRCRAPLFSPTVVESNAAMLLQFLKDNCTRENCTYLLRRNAGETNIELFDITSVSGQRQRKWIWWLAMISYRFAMRLDQLARNVAADEATKRNYRSRQRSLLQNSLELIHDLADMDGGNHETMSASVSEQLADTYLWENTDYNDYDKMNKPGGKNPSWQEKAFTPPCSSSNPSTNSTHVHPYDNVNVDGLTKAQDNLVKGIMALKPALERAERHSTRLKIKQKQRAEKHARMTSGNDNTPPESNSNFDNSESDNESDEGEGHLIEIHAIAMQMYGLHHKVINVSLRLAEQYLRHYSSSSAMQAIRTAGRRIAEESKLLDKLDRDISTKTFIQSISKQYAWVWECCGNFARSFAADEMWRERGHTSGDDVISLLQDVDISSSQVKSSILTELGNDRVSKDVMVKGLDDFLSLTERTKGVLNLNVLSGIIPLLDDGGIDCSKIPNPSVNMANSILDKQKAIKRDERKVLVAATLSYSNASVIYSYISAAIENPNECTVKDPSSSEVSILSMLRQRFGDACNEIGKILLTVVKDLIKSGRDMIPISSMLLSAEFWFLEGLNSFEKLKDVKNLSLLRCNLSQCCKIHANANLDIRRKPLTHNSASLGNGLDSRIELCLQDAARHLELAHEALGQRELDPKTWDMVSEELAATFLILGVKRRQSLIGSTPVVAQALRLNPGRERCILEPMERAKIIYEALNNGSQAAAADYHMALFYSKVWTCQRDEAKTREKLSAAFRHFSVAHRYYFAHMRSCEPTFIILCLDLSNLYSAVSAQGCLQKALLCCIDTCDAFSPEAVREAKVRQSNTKRQHEDNWMKKMETLASSVEKRIFKLLPSLVKNEKELGEQSTSKFMDLYRVILTMKIKSANEESVDENRIFPIYDILLRLRKENLAN